MKILAIILLTILLFAILAYDRFKPYIEIVSTGTKYKILLWYYKDEANTKRGYITLFII